MWCKLVINAARITYRRQQKERLMARASLESSAAEQMIAAQMPLMEKIARADHVVWNNGPLAVLTAQAGMLANLWKP